MKNIIYIIISLLIYFSTLNSSFASEGYIEKLLNLTTGIEEYDIDLPEIEYINFYNKNLNITFNNYVEVNKVLKNEILKKYKNGDFEYYTMKGITTNYKKYIYHSNKLFYYTHLKEVSPNYIETNNAILSNYRLTKNYYNRMKKLIYQKD